MRQSNTDGIAQCGMSRATPKATGHGHWATTHSVLPQRPPGQQENKQLSTKCIAVTVAAATTIAAIVAAVVTAVVVAATAANSAAAASVTAAAIIPNAGMVHALVGQKLMPLTSS
jgi:hypothetical protein